jgi:hypothetical protein
VLSRSCTTISDRSITAMKLCALALASKTPQARARHDRRDRHDRRRNDGQTAQPVAVVAPSALDMLGSRPRSARGGRDARTSRVRIDLQLSPLPRRPSPDVELACSASRRKPHQRAAPIRSDDVTLRLQSRTGTCCSRSATRLRVRSEGRHGLGLLTMRERAQQAAAPGDHIRAGRGSCVARALPAAGLTRAPR